MSLQDLSTFLQKVFISKRVSAMKPKQAMTLPCSANVEEALQMMRTHKFGCVVVADNKGKAVGVFTERDVIKKLVNLKADPSKVLLGNVMSSPILSVTPGSSIARLIHSFHTYKCRHIIVTDVEQEQIQIVSANDLIDFVYSRIAKHIVEVPECNESANVRSDKFFFDPVSVLKCHSPLMVKLNQSLRMSCDLLAKDSLGCVLIAGESGKLQGIFTERDYITRVLSHDLAEEREIKDYMTPSPRTILESSTVALAFTLMSEGHYRHLPVVDHLERPIGVLSIKNFIDFLSNCIVEDLSAPRVPAHGA